ncbi:MAG: RNA polymerase sporulation sigma factor SigK [Clostridia bacterium]|nr:RNA polymerase sporulation sigma factor SigK [Clostridia bacterium]
MLLKLIKKLIRQLKKGLNLCDINDLVCYLCGNEALPLPLDSEEEKILIEECMKGNSVARGKLIEHNLRLVVYISKKFDNSGIELEDLISIGAIGLIKAVQTYKFDKQIKLATYASRCIENEILMQLRKTSKIRGEVSFDEPLNYDADGNELLLSDILFTEADIVSKDLDQSVEKQLLWDSIKKLNEREREIMVLRFGLAGKEERTQKEVADMMGISQSYISRIEKKILDRLKKELLKVSNY